jgi:hypothetical protein
MLRIRASLMVAAVLISGCSVNASTSTTHIDSAKAEKFVKQAFTTPPRSVSCPSGVEAKAGRTLTCKVTSASGRRYDVTLHIVDSTGRVNLKAGDVRPSP